MSKLELLDKLWDYQEEIRKLVNQSRLIQDRVNAVQKEIDKLNAEIRELKEKEHDNNST